ncbi:MAG: TonB-dependent receptor [candidate division Zixibacteria bacterium]|nr:TonB-dependent receptor [candidate division Zixibacteria bacterium]
MLALFSAANLSAQSNTRLAGTVVNADDGAPVFNAEVSLEGTSYRTGTDASGLFRLDNVPPGTYRLRVTAAGYQPSEMAAVELVADITRQIRIVLARKIYPVAGVTVKDKRPIHRGDVVVVDRREIERLHPNNISEILESIEGVHVQQTGPGGQTQVRIRGSTPEQVLILLDGHRINSSANGIADLSTVPVAMVERIEVHKSGASAQFGPDAMGGVVSIITQPSGAAEPTGLETETSRNSWHTQRHQVVLVNPLKSVTFGNRVAISDNSSHGDFDFTYHASPVDTVFYGPRVNNRSTSRNYFVGGRWRPGRTRIGYSLQVYRSTNGLPGPASRPTQFAFREDDRLLAGVRFEHQLSSRLRTQLSAGSSRFVQFFRDRSDPVINQYETRFTEKGLDVKALFEWRSDRYHRLQVGGQIQRNALDHVDYMREVNATGKTVRTTNSAFINDRYPIDLSGTGVLDDLTLTASIRYDNALTSPRKTKPRYPWEEPRQAVRTESWSPHFGVTVSRGNRLHLLARASWGKSLRLPSINALFWQGDARAEGNPDLKPERSEHLDGGFELSGRHEQFELSAGLTFYRNNVDDLVIWVQGAPDGVFKPENLGAARITGHEDFVRLKAFDDVLEIAYSNSITHARNKQPGHNTYDKWLTYTPRYVTTFSVRLDFRPFHVGYNGRKVAVRYATADNYWSYDAYALHDLTVGTQIAFTPRWRLQLDGRLRNVTDEQYTLIAQHPMTGREYNLSMKLTFTPKEQKK